VKYPSSLPVSTTNNKLAPGQATSNTGSVEVPRRAAPPTWNTIKVISPAAALSENA
jgi:hypothetical protein